MLILTKELIQQIKNNTVAEKLNIMGIGANLTAEDSSIAEAFQKNTSVKMLKLNNLSAATIEQIVNNLSPQVNLLGLSQITGRLSKTFSAALQKSPIRNLECGDINAVNRGPILSLLSNSHQIKALCLSGENETTKQFIANIECIKVTELVIKDINNKYQLAILINKLEKTQIENLAFSNLRNIQIINLVLDKACRIPLKELLFYGKGVSEEAFKAISQYLKTKPAQSEPLIKLIPCPKKWPQASTALSASRTTTSHNKRRHPDIMHAAGPSSQRPKIAISASSTQSRDLFKRPSSVLQQIQKLEQTHHRCDARVTAIESYVQQNQRRQPLLLPVANPPPRIVTPNPLNPSGHTQVAMPITPNLFKEPGSVLQRIKKLEQTHHRFDARITTIESCVNQNQRRQPLLLPVANPPPRIVTPNSLNPSGHTQVAMPITSNLFKEPCSVLQQIKKLEQTYHRFDARITAIESYVKQKQGGQVQASLLPVTISAGGCQAGNVSMSLSQKRR